MLFLLSCILGLCIQVSFIIVENKKKYLPAVILKGTASLIFVALGILSMQLAKNQSFAKLVVTGLILGALGDILLNLRFCFEKIGQKIFLIGILAFFSGHILYLSALIPFCSNLFIYILCGAVVAALLLWWIFSKVGKIKKSFKIFGIVYIGAIAIMNAVAIGWLITDPTSVTALLYVIGAVLFLASDVIMIFNTFGSTQKLSMRASNLILYYIGQLFIALCIQFI